MTTTLDPFNEGTWSEGERPYFREIDEAQEKKLNLLISNGKPAHAAYLVDKFFRHAQDIIRLFSGRLSQQVDGVKVYGNPHIHNALEALFWRGCRLRVVLEKPIDALGGDYGEHPLVQLAERLSESGAMKGALEIRMAAPKAIAFLEENDYLHHWMVMDDHAYRLEADTGAVKAHANFNDKRAASALTSIFDDLLFKTGAPLVAIP